MRKTVSRFQEQDRRGLARLFAALSIGIILLSMPATASAAPTGSSFNHIVIIAMENQSYGSVIGSSSAPFINSLANLGTTISNYITTGKVMVVAVQDANRPLHQDERQAAILGFRGPQVHVLL